MAFRIKSTGDTGKEFRRILIWQLDRALQELADVSPGLEFDAVYNVRHRLKKIRTMLRLVRFSGDSSLSHIDREYVKEAAKSLAPMRDADVKHGTAAKLLKRCHIDPGSSSQVLDLLHREKIQAAARGVESMANASSLLKNARLKLESWNGEAMDWNKFLPGMTRCYKQARNAFEKAAKQGSSKVLHRCRKRTKDFLHALLLLRATHSKTIHRLTAKAEKLGERLGKDHDLAELRRALENENFGDGIKPLLKQIVSKRETLRAKTMKLGAQLYSERPKDFVEKFGGNF